MRDSAHLRALGDYVAALHRTEESWKALPGSPTLSAELIRLYGPHGKLEMATRIYEDFKAVADTSHIPFITNILIDIFHRAGRSEDAQKLLNTQPATLLPSDALDAAILAKRLNKFEAAHRYFERAVDIVMSDSRALHEFAQTKIKLAQKAFHAKASFGKETNKRLLLEARELLERVVQLDADQVRRAWAWRDLAKVKEWLKASDSEIKAAFSQAIDLLPTEKRFNEELKQWERNRH